MSVSLYWEPVTPGGAIKCGRSTGGSVRTALQKAFGTLPIQLSTDDIPMLVAMAAVHGRDEQNPYEQIVDLIHNHGSIRITFSV